MPPGSIQEIQLGLVKEVVRGTLVTPAVIFHAIAGDSNLDFTPEYIDDETKRGVNANFPAERGVNNGAGVLKAPLRASDIGEYLQMAMGSPSSALITTALGFRHTYDGGAINLALPTYSAHLNRGATLGVKAATMLSVNQLTISQDEVGLMQWEAAVLFQNELAGNIGAPSFASASEEFAPGQAQFKIDTVAQPCVKTWSIVIDNNMLAQRAQNGSRNIKDIVNRGPQRITGEALFYFDNLDERNKFLAGTANQITIKATSEEIIEDAQAYDLEIDIPRATWRAFPYGEDEGLFAAAAEFEGEYDIASSRLFRVELVNKKVAY